MFLGLFAIYQVQLMASAIVDLASAIVVVPLWHTDITDSHMLTSKICEKCFMPLKH